MIRVLIADDHTLVRNGIRRMLEEEDDITVVAESATGEETLAAAHEHQPSVILLDIAMPGMDGFETTKQLLRKRKATPKIVILTMYADEHYAARLLRMGALGYVVKDAAPSELVEAIRAVDQGRRFVSVALREALAMRYIDGLDTDPVSLLTDREFQVLRLLAAGATNREIAQQFALSVKTIDAHRLNILGKLGLRNNAELANFATRAGLVTP